jgi:exonuclease SbcC
MKICKIQFENIHSLKGKHTIDFENGLIGDAGLFVITGPTGAGKSTILDVITLALYNKIPRINGQITENVIEKEGVILTKNATDCFAEVEFEVKNKKYRSTWSIRRTKNNTLANRKQELIDVSTGEILFSSLSEVVKETEKIIGLNYDQFVQSMILAQGQFSKLLLSNKDDRNKLLEEITGSSIYRNIGSAVYDRFDKSKKAVDDKKLIMGENLLLDEEVLTSIKTDIEEKEPLLKSKQTILDTLNLKKATKERLIVVNSLKAENEQKWAEHLLEKENSNAINELLTEHNKVIKFKDDLFKIEAEEKLVATTTQSIQSTTNQIDTKENEKIDLLKKATLFINNEVTDNNYTEKIEDFRKQVVELVLTENDKKNKTTNELSRINDKINELKRANIAIKKDETIIEQIQNHLNDIEEKSINSGLENNEILNQRKIELLELIGPASEAILNRKLYDAEYKNQQETEAKIKTQNEEVKQIISDINVKTKDFKISKSSLENVKKELDEWNKRKSFDDHRNDLEIGKPCPLCGSEEHPFVTELKESLSNTLTDKFNDLTKTTESLHKLVLQLDSQKDTINKNIVTENEKLKKQTEKCSEYKTIIASYCDKLNWDFNASINDWESTKKSFENKLKEIEILGSMFKSKILLEELKSIYTSYLGEKKEYEAILINRKALFSGEDVSKESGDFTKKIDLIINSLNSLKSQKKGFEKTLIDSNKVINDLKEALMPNLLKINIESLEQLKSKLVKEEDAEKFRKKLDSLKEVEVSLKTTKETIEKELFGLLEKDDNSITLELLIESIKNITDELELLKKHIWNQKKKIEDDATNRIKQAKSQSELDALLKDLTLWDTMNRLIGDRAGKKFSNFVQDLTLKKLVEFGNNRLKGFSDRYMMEVEQESDSLKVIDTYMGNTKRAVNSLSGGETFKLSLALAFGLSDLAAKNVEIESLFIDEGFGTLDPESLDQAITLLENMQSESNKSIGIISHVSELKDRIGTKIKLKKTSAGYSTIEIE